MRLGFLRLGALIVAGSVGVIAAQHGQREAHTAPTREVGTHQSPHRMCESHQGAGDHHEEMAATLGLSAEQTSTIERISSEACAAIATYHERIEAVLTPEQRATMQEHHGATDHSGKAHSSTRRHGGK